MRKDLQFSWRSLRARPLFTAIAVLSLALGIGANTAIFSVIESSLLRGLPYRNAERLAVVNITNPHWEDASMSAPEFVEYQRQARMLSGLAAFSSQSLVLTGAGDAHKLAGESVTPNYFDVLGATAERGRLLSPEIDKPGAETRTAVISDSLWRSGFGSDPKIVGRDITLSGMDFRIVGVLSPKQEYPNGAQVWLSARYAVPERNESESPNNYLTSYGEYYLTALARTKQGITLAEAQAEALVIFENNGMHHPQAKYDSPSLQALQDSIVQRMRPALWTIVIAVVLLLLIACANLAGLLLARATGRTREFAVRLAVGATRTEIMRLSLAESLLLAAGGCILGVAIAAAGVKLIAHSRTFHLPAALAPEINIPVLLFCVAVSALSALLSGLIPALQSSQTDVNTGLKEGGKGSASQSTHRLRGLLVSAEIAISVMLLIAAGLLVHSFAKLISVDPGFNPRGALTAHLSLSETSYKTDAEINGFWRRLLSSTSVMPGVSAAGLLNYFPFSGSRGTSLVRIEGRHYASIMNGLPVNERAVSPETFKALGVPLLAGRVISEKDTADSPFVAVISKRFADVAFPHENPIGKRYDGAHISGWITIVGVVGNVTFQQLSQAPELDAYYSYQQDATTYSGIILRGNPSVHDLRRIVHNLDPNVPVTSVRPLGDYVSQSLASRRFLLELLTTFSGLAILLAGIGLYAILAYSVQQRKQEIGIRVALGATSADVLWLVLRECLVIVLMGTALGSFGASWATSLLKSMLYGVTSTDLAAYTAAVILILAVALAASLAPAIRATKIDPVNALRYE